jgi:hypothetical protein
MQTEPTRPRTREERRAFIRETNLVAARALLDGIASGQKSFINAVRKDPELLEIAERILADYAEVEE